MFEEIVAFICAGTGFVLGTDLYEGHRPQDKPDRCVLIAESGGGATVPELPDRADPLIQALSRSRSYFEARADCWAVYHLLHGDAGRNMPRLPGSGSGPDFVAWTIDALAIPQYIGPDKEGRHEFSCNFIFRMAEARCGSGPSGP